MEDGTLLNAGSQIQNPCSKATCKIVNGSPILKEEVKFCPPLPHDCKDGQIVMDESGCCRRCLRCRDNLNVTRKVGETWKSSPCTTCMCSGYNINCLTLSNFRVDDGGISCTSKACPPLSPECPNASKSLDPDGCCTFCNLPLTESIAPGI